MMQGSVSLTGNTSNVVDCNSRWQWRSVLTILRVKNETDKWTTFARQICVSNTRLTRLRSAAMHATATLSGLLNSCQFTLPNCGAVHHCKSRGQVCEQFFAPPPTSPLFVGYMKMDLSTMKVSALSCIAVAALLSSSSDYEFFSVRLFKFCCTWCMICATLIN